MEQARSLKQTSTSMASLVSAVQVNATDAQAADGLAASVRHAAEGGHAIVESAVVSMQGLEKGSSQMTDIIGVINGIAFQTNILALNAAVAAARAGEASRSLHTVVQGISQMADKTRVISQSSATQRSGLQDMEQSVQSLDGITQSNAKMGGFIDRDLLS